MPLQMKPPVDQLMPTKDVTPEGLETEGPAAEWFRIPKIFDEAVNKTALEESLITTQKGRQRPVDQERDNDKYRRMLIALNLKAWRLIVPPGEPFNDKTMYQEDGNYFWQFIPENVATLPPDAVVWLSTEILSVSSVIPTESLLVKTKSGKRVLDFRRSGESVCEGEGQRDVDSLGDEAISQGVAGARHARGGRGSD